MDRKKRLCNYYVSGVRWLFIVTFVAGFILAYYFEVALFPLPSVGIICAYIHFFGINKKVIALIFIKAFRIFGVTCWANLFSYRKDKTRWAYKIMTAFIALDLFICLFFVIFNVSAIYTPKTYLGGYSEIIEIPTKPYTTISGIVDIVIISVYIIYLRGKDFLKETKNDSSLLEKVVQYFHNKKNKN